MPSEYKIPIPRIGDWDITPEQWAEQNNVPLWTLRTGEAKPPPPPDPNRIPTDEELSAKFAELLK